MCKPMKSEMIFVAEVETFKAVLESLATWIISNNKKKVHKTY